MYFRYETKCILDMKLGVVISTNIGGVLGISTGKKLLDLTRADHIGEWQRFSDFMHEVQQT